MTAGAARTGRLILLGAVAALGSLAIQIIVPALPALVADLRASPTDGQLVIAAYLVTLAAGQLIWAPIADRFGRRPAMLFGLVIFCIGTGLCAVAPNLAVLVIARIVQAVGAASSLITARAMATDHAPAGQAAAPLAVLTSITLISPAIAPVIGGGLTSLAGWRMLFAALALLGGAGLAAVYRFAPETRIGDGEPMHPEVLLRRYADVCRGPGFLPLALANALISSGFYLFLAVSPFILHAAGIGAVAAGLCYAVVASGIILGTLAVPRIVRRDPHWLTPFGAAVIAMGSIMLIAAVLSGGVGWLIGAMTIVAFGSGLTGPALLGEAIERQRDRAASVASLFGTLQMGSAALLSTIVVRAVGSTSVEIALIGVLMLGSVAVRRLAR